MLSCSTNDEAPTNITETESSSDTLDITTPTPEQASHHTALVNNITESAENNPDHMEVISETAEPSIICDIQLRENV